MSPTASDVKGPDPSRDKVNRQAGEEEGNQKLRPRVQHHKMQCLPKKAMQLKHVLYVSDPDKRGIPCCRGTCTSGDARTWVNPTTSTIENGTQTKQGGHTPARSMFRHLGPHRQGHVKKFPSVTCREQSRAKAEGNRQGYRFSVAGFPGSQSLQSRRIMGEPERQSGLPADPVSLPLQLRAFSELQAHIWGAACSPWSQFHDHGS